MVILGGMQWNLPSGNVLHNSSSNSPFSSLIYLFKMVIFDSYVNVYHFGQQFMATSRGPPWGPGALAPPRFAHSTADDDMSIPTQTDVGHPTGAPTGARVNRCQCQGSSLDHLQ